MIKEIKTARDYFIFLQDFPDISKKDVATFNFIRSFKTVNVGCSCKKKTRIKVCLYNKKKSVENIYKNFKQNIVDFYENLDYKEIRFYEEGILFKSIKINE